MINIKYLKYKNKYLKLKNQIGGSIYTFLVSYNLDINLLKEIGRGGFGTVYLDNSQSDVVFKISQKANICREWKSESIIYNKLNEQNIDEKLCKLIKMNDYKVNSESCIMELTRAKNPIDINLNYTIQPQFGMDNLNYYNKGRGLFLGIKELIDSCIFTNENIKEYIKELALIISKLHYKIKNDGYDLELFLSRENNLLDDTKHIVIYIGDFDLSKFITDYDKKTIERLEWSLSAVPYFPTKDQSELFDIFITNYISEADNYGLKDIAIKVMELYQDN